MCADPKLEAKAPEMAEFLERVATSEVGHSFNGAVFCSFCDFLGGHNTDCPTARARALLAEIKGET